MTNMPRIMGMSMVRITFGATFPLRIGVVTSV